VIGQPDIVELVADAGQEALGVDRFPRLQRQLDVLQAEPYVVDELGGNARDEVVRRRLQTLGEQLDQPRIRAPLTGFDPGDVPDSHIVAGHRRLGETEGHPKLAEPLAELLEIDVTERIAEVGVHPLIVPVILRLYRRS
jgi:hypothetical protein